MRIGFFSSRIPFEPDLIENGLGGGSENAFCNLIRELKSNYPDDEIIVYNNNSGKYKEYGNCEWKTLLDFQLDVRSFNLDCLISLREPHIFRMPYIDTKLKILWSQDICNESELVDLQKNKYAIENIDLFLSNSEFSYKDLKNGFPNSNIKILKNGYNKNFVDNYCIKEDVAIYCSTPFRGLSHLLELWPKIYEGCCEYNIYPKLKIYGGMELYKQSNENFMDLYNNLSNLQNVEVCGSIPQKELYKHLNKSKIILYPNIWLETSCMVLLEAIACGNWSISTDLGALDELIINDVSGNIIDGNPKSKKYQDKFIEYSIDAFVKNKRPKIDHLNTWKNQSILLKKIIEEII